MGENDDIIAGRKRRYVLYIDVSAKRIADITNIHNVVWCHLIPVFHGLYIGEKKVISSPIKTSIMITPAERESIVENIDFAEPQWDVKFQNNTHSQVADFLSFTMFSTEEYEIIIPKKVLVNVLEKIWPDRTIAITLREIAREILK